ncbi:NACHT, LRR and PYD domains-containing protein 13 [Talpa occidentalis]|uniref:NACHT, LRR and PYD domains-containing protein 13 n=1 Tax=Talpa occidentalis TaxID=50954 RepID=UPI00188E1050|nr:NACHT, LRR and PYD domains-containing protein 13 [Talpa occidentalis]
MSAPGPFSVDDGAWDLLLTHLTRLDGPQLEEFKLQLQSRRLLSPASWPFSWADLRALEPSALLGLLHAHFPEGEVWGLVAGALRSMNLTSLSEEVGAARAEMLRMREPQDPVQEYAEVPEGEAHRRYRERVRARVLAMWDQTPWPEGHVHLRSVTALEHEELQAVLSPGRSGAQPLTVVLEGGAGVGKTTVAAKVLLHWAESLLFERRFSWAFYVSCHALRDAGSTSLAGLLSQDWPDSPLPVAEFQRRPERLLFMVDGLEELDVPPGLGAAPPGLDWHQELPAARLLLHLLKKELAPAATLLVTARDCRRRALGPLLVRPWFLAARGFAEADQLEYFIRFFGDHRRGKKTIQWLRKHEALGRACHAPLVCWVLGSALKWGAAQDPLFQLDDQTATGLYAGFLQGLLAPEVGQAGPGWPDAWRALCGLAAQGLWLSRHTFSPEDLAPWGAAAPLLDLLLRACVLRKVPGCEGCVTFTHHSFQEFLGALFYVLRGAWGAVGPRTKSQEVRELLSGALLGGGAYWAQTALFLFGLLNRDRARALAGELRCELAPRAADELLEWAEGLAGGLSAHLDALRLFLCLHEAGDEDVARQVLGLLLEAEVAVVEHAQLRAAAFCLPLCGRLRKLKLAIRGLVPPTRAICGPPAPGARPVAAELSQWRAVCAVCGGGVLRELELSGSSLAMSSMRALCEELRRPRCRLQRLACTAITPMGLLKELVVVLHGNSRLTHLDLSANNLGVTVAKMLFQTLGHSACNLRCLWNSSLSFLSLGDNNLGTLREESAQGTSGGTAEVPPGRIAGSTSGSSPAAGQRPLKELSLEKCSLSAAAFQHLAPQLSSLQQTTRLCLGLNPLGDEGVRLLCASLARPECALQRLELRLCQLGAPSCGYLADALPQNRSLTHLSLGRNHLGDEGVTLLCVALGRPGCRLRRLDLSSCAFGQEGCRELAGALGRNRCLDTLDVGHNGLGDEGVRLLCEALRPPEGSLVTLGLEKCGLTPAGCPHLASVLRSSQSLVGLNLLGNSLRPEGFHVLWKTLARPTSRLQKLGLERDLYRGVQEELAALQEAGSGLRIKCKWDFDDAEDKWWWPAHH